MKLSTLLRLTTAGLLLGTAARTFAFDALVDFDQQSDLSLFNYVVNQNATLGFGSVSGVEGLGGGVFQSTAAIGDEKHVIAALAGSLDSTLTTSWTASFTIKYSQLRPSTQPANTDYSTTVRIGFASTDTLGAGFAAKDFFGKTPSFSMYTKFEHDLTKPQDAYMSLDMNGNAAASPLNSTRQKLLTFDSDTWYRLELTITRSATTADAYDFSSKAFDLGLSGIETPIQVLSIGTATLINPAFSLDSSIFPIFQFDGEKTSPGTASETFVDNVTFHAEQVPEPASALLAVPMAALLLGRRRRRALV